MGKLIIALGFAFWTLTSTCNDEPQPLNPNDPQLQQTKNTNP
jgi:hypothetical protein